MLQFIDRSYRFRFGILDAKKIVDERRVDRHIHVFINGAGQKKPAVLLVIGR